MSYAELPLVEFLEQLGARTPAPASGTATALAAAMAAGLAELSAGISDDDATLAEAGELRERLVHLADEDAAAYAGFMRTRSDEDRQRTIDVPLAIAEAATRVAELGERLVEHGKRSVVGDSAAAATLGRACAEVAARLVEINRRG